MIKSYWQEFAESTKKVLLLQGPVGPFFLRFAEHLEVNHSLSVYKINFNGGDRYYYPESTERSSSYTGSVSDFADYLTEFVAKNDIDAIVCFGHQRVYHCIAKEVCLENSDKLSFWAFEEGYLRPHYVTFEKWGVNSNSSLPQDASYYISHLSEMPEPPEPQAMACGFIPRAKLAACYYIEMARAQKDYPQYKHHRETKLSVYLSAWLRSAYRYIRYRPRENRFAKRVDADQFGRFFIVPLQVYNDSQVTMSSSGKSVPAFIRYVISSFSKHGPIDTQLIFKHHPMDRGFNHYGQLIKKLSHRYQVEGRVHYVFDVRLPILMRKGQGMVLLNSTSGLSAMIHGLSVKALGQAHYDFPELTDQQELATFWSQPVAPNPDAFESYRRYLLYKTQINGNFYRTEKAELPLHLSCFHD